MRFRDDEEALRNRISNLQEDDGERHADHAQIEALKRTSKLPARRVEPLRGLTCRWLYCSARAGADWNPRVRGYGE
jgi:hypothetical protein